jgi:hypothetical protein
MIRDRPTNRWHLHRGKRRELEYDDTARLADSVTGVLASVDVAIGLCTMWRAMVEHAPDDRMPSRFPGPARLNIGLELLLRQMLAFPQASQAGHVGLAQHGQSRFAWSPASGRSHFLQPSLRKSAWQPGYTLMQWNAVGTVCQSGAE